MRIISEAIPRLSSKVIIYPRKTFPKSTCFSITYPAPIAVISEITYVHRDELSWDKIFETFIGEKDIDVLGIRGLQKNLIYFRGRTQFAPSHLNRGHLSTVFFTKYVT